ncbi:hypothetical protein V6Z11_A03G174600 [Gossypium hirsutum]
MLTLMVALKGYLCQKQPTASKSFSSCPPRLQYFNR